MCKASTQSILVNRPQPAVLAKLHPCQSIPITQAQQPHCRCKLSTHRLQKPSGSKRGGGGDEVIVVHRRCQAASISLARQAASLTNISENPIVCSLQTVHANQAKQSKSGQSIFLNSIMRIRCFPSHPIFVKAYR